LILTRGLVRAIYAEEIPIQLLGNLRIERASHVEPDVDGNWWADLAPSKGPVLGPFTHRSLALQAEHDWLTANVLFGPASNSMKVENPTDETLPSHEVAPASITPATSTFQTSAGGPDIS
ncbi:MAG: hypothetical protein JWM11_975, partial [Planctomycetaceae bacterium]|nr:hypothetical protein [Planctomycetaceae bacterium]